MHSPTCFFIFAAMSNRSWFFSLILMLLFTPLISNGQVKDGVVTAGSAQTVEGNVADSTLTKKHSPKKAALMSAVLPGLGQVYNQKYWKVPLIYALGGTLIYFASQSSNSYNKYRETLITRIDSTYNGTDHFPEIPNVEPNSAIQEEMERTRKNMELAIIGTVLVYMLQIVDATVDAHLKYFDVSDDLSLMVKPKVYLPNVNMVSRDVRPMMGIQLNFKIK